MSLFEVVAVRDGLRWGFIVGYYWKDFNPDAVCLDPCAVELSRVLISLPDSSPSLQVTAANEFGRRLKRRRINYIYLYIYDSRNSWI